MNKFVLRAAIPIAALIVFALTFIDFNENESELPQLVNSEWIYSCGKPDNYERIIFYENGKCWYSSKDVYGVFKSAEGYYIHDEEKNEIGVRFFEGDRNHMITYKMLSLGQSENYYIGEVYSDIDVRHFIYQDNKNPIYYEKPTFQKSEWTYSCGDPYAYELIEINEMDQVKHSKFTRSGEVEISHGTGEFSIEDEKYHVTYTSGNRSFDVTYQMYRESAFGKYYLLEKWSETDVRYFIHVK